MTRATATRATATRATATRATARRPWVARAVERARSWSDPRPRLRDVVPGPVRRADRAAYAAIARTRLPLVGPLLPRLSRAADRSRLWLVLAGLLAAVGGREGRRAAAHGVVAIAVTSTVTNLPAKLLTGRPRPFIEQVPQIRRLTHTPRSTSFPSGHTASAFAFATAVGREVPAARVPLLTLAAGVGLSRVYTGVHYPGDVLVGAVLGVTVGRATAAPWGGEDPTPARARPVSDTPPLAPDGAGLVVVTNAAAGGGVDDALDRRIRARLPAARVVAVEEGEDLPGALRRGAEHATVLGIAGGDGSANAAVAVAQERGLPLLVVPTGTLNHLARDLGIADVEGALDAAVSGCVVAIDLVEFAGRPSANVASVGVYPRLVDARERLEDRLGKWPALLWCLLRETVRGEPLSCRLDGVPRRVWSITVGNGRFDTGGLVPTRRRRLDEGVLEVRAVAADRLLARTRLLVAVLTGRVDRSVILEERVATEVRIEADRPLRVARDGESSDGPATVVAVIRPAALHVVRPREDD